MAPDLCVRVCVMQAIKPRHHLAVAECCLAWHVVGGGCVKSERQKKRDACVLAAVAAAHRPHMLLTTSFFACCSRQALRCALPKLYCVTYCAV